MERPARQWGLLHVITTLFEPLLTQFRGDGDTSRTCAGSGFTNSQDDLPPWRQFAYSTQVVWDTPKHPNLP